LIMLEVNSNVPHKWIHPEHRDAAELAKKFARRENMLWPICHVPTREI
jgi:hypothetical protein